MKPSRACDFLIIGAGASGSVVAARLAAAFPHADIVLVEAGTARPGLVNSVPLLSGFAPFRRGTNWYHPAQGPDGEVLLYQGRMRGGSSELNGMVVSRGSAADYAAWETAAGPEWSWDRCLAAFRGLEHGPRAAVGDWHGSLGPLHVRPIEPYGPLPEAFLDAAAQAGFPRVDDLNAAEGARFGLADVNILRGRRHSASRAFLTPWPRNVRLMAGWIARRLVTRSGRVVAVEMVHGDEASTLDVRAETLLCLGAIGTAGLLLKSGIGPARDLAAAGIAPVLDLPEVGANLQNHPSWLLRAPTRGGSLTDLLSPVPGVAAASRWLARGEGPLAQGLFQAAGYFGTDEARRQADLQVVMSPALFPPTRPGRRPPLPLRHGASFAIQIGSPASRGRVSLFDCARLRIDTGTLSNERDIDLIEAGIARVQDILAQPAFRRHLADEEPLAPVHRDRIRTGMGSAWHMAGTARMGLDAAAVTDPRLRLNGLAGLRIADASVMPLIPNAALHFPTMMIAARAAEFAVAEYGQSRRHDGREPELTANSLRCLARKYSVQGMCTEMARRAG